ncbi:MAG: hypothetical protein LBQ09_06305, partial [Acidobacteriaceae bacterium]|nr:hypothetical protein [Acidobacteriaceae bacterium]
MLSALVLIAVQSVMPDSAWAQTYTVLDGGTFSGNVPANPADGSTIDLQGVTATGNVTVTLPTGAGGLTINSATGESVVAIDSTVLGTNGTALFTNTTTGSVIVNLTGGLVTFTGGSANLDGAVITSSSGVTINGSDVTFSDNKAGRSGGALIVRKLATAPSGNLVINADNVTLTNNTARAEGGALFTSNGAIVIGNGAGAILVQNNSSNGAVNDVSGTFHTGGAISAGTTSTNTTPSTLTINGASITILGNSLTGRQQVVGGAIYARRGVTLISSGAVELSGNSVSGSSGVVTSSVYGGAIGVGFGSELIPVTITGDTITLTHNTATATATTGAVQAVGGAIYATGEITLTAAGKIDAEGNKAITPGLAGGGALYSGRGAVTLTGSEIVLSDNYVSGSSAL